MTERRSYVPPEAENKPPEEMDDKEYVAWVFETILRRRQERARRTPVVFERVWNAIKGSNSDLVPFDEIAKYFPSEKSAYNALSHLSDILDAYGIEIEHVACYRFRRRKG